MSARVYLLADLLSTPALLSEVGARLSRGEICVYPTETIYGIGGRADSEDVRARILSAKRRPPENPMILIAASVAAFERLDLIIPEPAKKLADAFWPGNLTLVLPLRQGNGTVGIRVSDHPFIQAIGPHVPAALFSTSANLSGEPYSGDPCRIRELFGDVVDFVVDAGQLPRSMPSTVVAVTADAAVQIVRQGAVEAERIRAVVAREGGAG